MIATTEIYSFASEKKNGYTKKQWGKKPNKEGYDDLPAIKKK